MSQPPGQPNLCRGLGILVFLTGWIFCTVCPLAAREQGDELAEKGAGGLTLLAALEAALRLDPAIASTQASLRAGLGSLEVQKADFDPVLSGLFELGRDNTGELSTDSYFSSTNAGLLLRSGLDLSTSVSLERSADEGPGSASNSSSLSVTFRQPLLRGRGEGINTAGERAAGREVLARLADLEQQIAVRLRTVASLYWSYHSAAVNLEILRDTEASSRRFLDNTRRLVAADLTPAADLVQLEADLLSRELARRSGERRLLLARQALGKEIGLDAVDIAGLPLPADPFPLIAPEKAPRLGDTARWTALAEARRADLRAAKLRVDAGEINLLFFENALRSRLDLVFTPSYTNVQTGDGLGDFFAPIYRDIPGLAATLGLSWSFAPRHRRDAGNLEVQRAALVQDRLALRSVSLQIGAAVLSAIDGIAFNAEQVASSRAALELFRKALENEEKKLRAGSSTLIDVINQQDRLIAARQRVVDAELGLALAFLDLRLETGTLIESPAESGQPATISRNAFLTIPADAGGPRPAGDD